MKNPKCREVAYRFITAYGWIDNIKDRMRLSGWGVHLGHLNEDIDIVSRQFDELSKDGYLTDDQLTSLRVILQDVRKHLPAVPSDFLQPEEGKRLVQPIADSGRLMDKLTEVMFESVSECECKASPESRGYYGGGRTNRHP